MSVRLRSSYSDLYTIEQHGRTNAGALYGALQLVLQVQGQLPVFLPSTPQYHLRLRIQEPAVVDWIEVRAAEGLPQIQQFLDELIVQLQQLREVTRQLEEHPSDDHRFATA